ERADGDRRAGEDAGEGVRRGHDLVGAGPVADGDPGVGALGDDREGAEGVEAGDVEDAGRAGLGGGQLQPVLAGRDLDDRGADAGTARVDGAGDVLEGAVAEV